MVQEYLHQHNQDHNQDLDLIKQNQVHINILFIHFVEKY